MLRLLLKPTLLLLIWRHTITSYLQALCHLTTPSSPLLLYCPALLSCQAADVAAAEGVRWSPAARELVGGVLAGAVNVTSGYPFDTMKVRLQAGTGGSSMRECFWSIWRTEGVSRPCQCQHSTHVCRHEHGTGFVRPGWLLLSSEQGCYCAWVEFSLSHPHVAAAAVSYFSIF